jgi:hypothetical protein
VVNFVIRCTHESAGRRDFPIQRGIGESFGQPEKCLTKQGDVSVWTYVTPTASLSPSMDKLVQAVFVKITLRHISTEASITNMEAFVHPAIISTTATTGAYFFGLEEDLFCNKFSPRSPVNVLVSQRIQLSPSATLHRVMRFK